MVKSNLLIVGAGFSSNAGLPLASQFTKELLRTEKLNLNGPSKRQVKFLQEFVKRIFGEGNNRSADEWPELEDVLTIIDLSANTGHHLGVDYSASDLLVRMIHMLEQRYTAASKKCDTNWETLEDFFLRLDVKNCSVLSMNWDTVIERGLMRNQKKELKQSEHWVFIGYSMPSADFEFKQLLKRVQLSEPIRPIITLITAGTGAADTVTRFEKFFGKVDKERFYFDKGLDSAALDHLRDHGLLRAKTLT
jgi:hypothetical protein